MRGVIALVALAVVSACAPIEIETEHDRSIDFSTLHSYDWLRETRIESGHPRLDDPVLHNRVRSAVERELAAMGFERIFEGRPDFWVSYHLSLRSRLDSQSISRGVGHAVGDSWGPGPDRHTAIHEYEKGTLIIDVVDARLERLVFRGAAKKRLEDNPSAEKSRQNIREAVEGILGEFPGR